MRSGIVVLLFLVGFAAAAALGDSEQELEGGSLCLSADKCGHGVEPSTSTIELEAEAADQSANELEEEMLSHARERKGFKQSYEDRALRNAVRRAGSSSCLVVGEFGATDAGFAVVGVASSKGRCLAADGQVPVRFAGQESDGFDPMLMLDVQEPPASGQHLFFLNCAESACRPSDALWALPIQGGKLDLSTVMVEMEPALGSLGKAVVK